MTYKELLDQLMMLDEEQLDQTVTVHDPYEDEHIAVVHTITTSEADVLDENHFVLVLKAWTFLIKLLLYLSNDSRTHT